MFKICDKDNMYAVSPDGEVKSLYTNKLLKKSLSNTGYYVVNIRVNGKRRPYQIHRLVAEAYLEKIQGKDYINHKDGNKLNNNIKNLEWCTDDENKNHAWQTGLMKRGQDCSKNGLKDSDVRDICTLIEANYSVGEILKELNHLNINKSVILNIRSFRSWRHISKDFSWEIKSQYRNNKAFTFNDQ